MNKTKSKIIIFLLALSVGCTSQVISTPDNAATFTTQPSQTLTHIIELTNTTTPIIPTKTPTLLPTPTWTPLSTLSISARNAKIKELLETNGGCELPCWWGITPEKTSWSEAIHFLSPFIVRSRQGEIIYRTEGGRRHLLTNFGIYYEIAGESEQGRILVGVIDDTVVGLSIFPPGTMEKFKINQLLEMYGLPAKILISAQSSAPIAELPPTMIILDYSDRGVWASYGYLPALVGDKLRICPQDFGKRSTLYDNEGGRLELFDPEEINTRMPSIEEYANMVSGYHAMKLEDVTNMTTTFFYNAFINSASTTCLETPANLWP